MKEYIPETHKLGIHKLGIISLKKVKSSLSPHYTVLFIYHSLKKETETKLIFFLAYRYSMLRDSIAGLLKYVTISQAGKRVTEHNKKIIFPAHSCV